MWTMDFVDFKGENETYRVITQRQLYARKNANPVARKSS